MNKKLYLFATIILLAFVIAMAGCKSAAATTKTTTTTTTAPPITTTTKTTSTPPPTTTTTITTTTSPATTTTTTPPPTTTTTTSSGNTLTLVALPLDPAFHPAAYDTLCMLCHAAGVGVQQYPLPPTWPGTPKTPGPWTIVPGSDQDHTGKVDAATCLTQTGCHTVNRGGTPTTTITPPTTTTTTPPATTTTTPPTTTSTATEPPPTEVPMTAMIQCFSTGFDPPTAYIAAGGTVTWENDEHQSINVTSSEGLFNFNVASEETFSFKFENPGTYKYFNSDQPDKIFQIIVI